VTKTRALGIALLALSALALSAALLLGTLRWWTDMRGRPHTYTPADVPARRVAIVFGAGVWPNGRLSAVLEDRVLTAVDLYRTGKVRKLLMTGDNRFVDYNEPAHMRAYALALGVPEEDIVLDYAGRRTYDSCYRARHIFGVTDAILLTQAYHLDRALFTARRLGIDAVGVPADRQPYAFIRRYWWREILATAVAWWQVTVSHPLPVMGDQLPIFAPGTP
jgi:SanA protein